MSRYPSATWKPIANRSTKALQKDLLSIHTMVGPGLGTWNYFNTGAGGRGVYSHLLVCGVWGSDAGKDVDGLVLQAQDTDLRAAANLDGNWHIVSVETADNAARPIAPWTSAQCDALVNIMVDANRLDGIPLVLVPDSKPGRRGISYHRMGCNPYRVAGGELWSEAYGKDCPTQARIDQIPALIDRARAIVAGEPEDFLMAVNATQDQWDAVVKAAQSINATAVKGTTGFEGTVEAMANKVNTLINEVRANAAITGDDEAHLTAKLDELQADVDSLKPGPTQPPVASAPAGSDGSPSAAEPTA